MGVDAVFEPVKWSMADLARQVARTGRAARPIRGVVTSVGIDVPSNSVDVQTREMAAARSLARSATTEPRVTVRQSDAVPTVTSCVWAYLGSGCDPFRGGQAILGTNTETRCSAGFWAVRGNDRFILTAGHCFNEPFGTFTTGWDARDPLGVDHFLGASGGWIFGTYHPSGPTYRDVAAINVSASSWWYNRLYPRVFADNFDENFPLIGRMSSYVGLFVCHLGVGGPNNGTNCGTVVNTGRIVNYGFDYNGDHVVDYWMSVDGLTQANGCAAGGDSGGPVVQNYYAMGILSGSAKYYDGSCAHAFYYGEVLDLEAQIGGVTVVTY